MLLERLATAQARCRNDRSLGLQDMTQIGAFTAAYILYLRFDPARCKEPEASAVVRLQSSPKSGIPGFE